MPKVEAVSVTVNGQAGYDIRVHDWEASVQDYIDTLNRFILDNRCYRSRRPELGACLGCDLCCHERIPVTVIDAFNLPDGSPEQAIVKSLHVYVEGQVVDITMRLDESGGCIYLDRTKGICKIYGQRPLVCQTFICCPSTPKAKLLREEIVNTGEDELVRRWFKTGREQGQPIIHEALSPHPDKADYPKTAFAGVQSYKKVTLKDICSAGLRRKFEKERGD